MKNTVSLLALVLALFALGACAGKLQSARNVVDLSLAVAVEAKQQLIAEAQVERLRIRAFRCFNPVLTIDAVSRAALNIKLGDAWIDELLDDCPQFSAFISDLVVRRAKEAGLTQ